MDDAGSPLPLSNLRVLELSQNPAGDLAGKLLGDLGATVVKLEDRDRLGLRAVGPFVEDDPRPENSLSFLYYNVGKRTVRLEGSFDESVKAEELLASADVFITTQLPAEHPELAERYSALAARHPRLIVTSITPFGLDGPWSHWHASDLVSLALGGPLNTCGYDDHDIPPIRPGGDQGFHTAASFAHIGTLMALIEREDSGRGQLVDIAIHDSLAVTVEMTFPYWEYHRTEVQRQTCRHAQPTQTQPALFQCADGGYVYLVLMVNEDRAWANLVQWLDGHDFSLDLTEEAYSDGVYRQDHFEHIQGIVESFFALNDTDTIYREGQEVGLPIGVLNAPEDLFADRHLVERGFFRRVNVEQLGEVVLPGPPYVFDRLAWRVGAGIA
jgi:benzylsuccinate CoA-transferase BbsE subunit